jgi:hypothetical protein
MGWALEEFAETAACLRRWEFLLVVAPLRAPVNPLAMF